MAQVNASTLVAARDNFNALFRESAEKAPVWWNQAAMLSPSTHAAEVYDFLNDLPELREWLGERLLKQLTGWSFTVTNTAYEATIGIKRADIERDALGLYTARIAEMGNLAAKHPDVLLQAKIVAAFADTIWDGATFFSNSHTLGDFTNDNLGTAGAPSNTTYDEARKLLASMVGINGRSIAPSGRYLLICGPYHEGAARRLLNAELINDGSNVQTSNVWRGTADLLVIPELGTSQKWVLMDAGRALKPWIFQREKAPEVDMVTNPNDGTVFKTGEFMYGVDYRGTTAHGLYWLAVGNAGA